MKKELDFKNYSWGWDDDNLLGNFKLTCPCGEKLKTDMLRIGEDKLKCKCGREFEVKRTTNKEK